MEEIWKTVEGWGSKYQVSNLGRLKNINSGKLITQTKNERGYHVVRLYHLGVKKTLRVHRMAAICFIENPHNLPEVNHIDGNKGNNCVDNLEWNSRKENELHYFLNHAGKNVSPILQIKDGRVIAEFENYQVASAFLGIPSFRLNAILLRKHRTKTWHGFAFIFKDSINLVDYPLPAAQPPAQVGEDAVEKEIVFANHLKCLLKIAGGKVEVVGAVNGYGDAIPSDEIKITDKSS